MGVWLTLFFISLATSLALWFLKLFTKPAKKRLPPGPWTLPIIGSLHHVVSRLPHRTMMELSRRHGPLMLLRLGEVDTLVVSSAEVAELVMKTNDLVFADRPHSATHDIIGCGGKNIFFSPSGKYLHQMRSTVNVSKILMALTNNIVTRAVFGGKFTQQGKYLHELDKVLTVLGGFCLVDLFPSSRLVWCLSNGNRQIKKAYGRIQHIICKVIEGRMAARAAGDGVTRTDEEDLLDVLLRLQQDDSLEFPLTTENIGAVLFDIFAGGTETKGGVLAWAMSELVHAPESMIKAQQEVRDVLGTNVYINVFAISRDPRYWNNPEDFKPERFQNSTVNYIGTNFEYVPFGAGRRQCPGIHFSFPVMEMVLTNLLYYFDWKLPHGASLASFDMSEKFGLAVTRRSDLQLRAVPHVQFKAMFSK
ncbi:hypothetical protein VPH35_034345 [Triticum aestivum]|uniref:Cytochrome P450 71D7 n=1 Tax=Aegilops tauschii TaxID=37682 RepID=M8B0I6_AEGTA